jgi:broad specificity phosphatase PhoE
MLRLYLLAHAPTAAQRQRRFPADEGIEPLEPDVARRLAAPLGACSAIWCAPERRAAETATALGLVATPCADLREWAAGAWTGQTVSWVAAHEPAAFQAWCTNPDATPPGGESLRALAARVAAWMDSQTAADGHALVIADPAVIRAAILHTLAADPPTFWRLEVPPLALSVVQYAAGQWRLRQLSIDFAAPASPLREA